MIGPFQKPGLCAMNYTEEPLGDLKTVPDLLPRPEELVFMDEASKSRSRFDDRTLHIPAR